MELGIRWIAVVINVDDACLPDHAVVLCLCCGAGADWADWAEFPKAELSGSFTPVSSGNSDFRSFHR